MIFGKSKQYPLPRFPETVIPLFWKLAAALPPERIPELRLEVRKAVDKLHRQAREQGGMDMRLAERLEAVCHFLMDRYEDFGEKQRALIIGGISYFIAHDDPFSELAFASGFDDDARVMNFVLEEIGIEDQFLGLE